MDTDKVIKYALKLIGLMPVVKAGMTDVIEKLVEGKEAIERMVEERRDPTDEEWELLNEATAMLRDSLHSDDH